MGAHHVKNAFLIVKLKTETNRAGRMRLATCKEIEKLTILKFELLDLVILTPAYSQTFNHVSNMLLIKL